VDAKSPSAVTDTSTLALSALMRSSHNVYAEELGYPPAVNRPEWF
jgi:hypothetical protein